MYKRKDWLHFHTAEGASSSSDDTASESGTGGDEGSDASPSVATSEEEEEQPDVLEGDGAIRRLEDLSEDDFEQSGRDSDEGTGAAPGGSSDENEEPPEEELGDVIRTWLQPSQDTVLKGRALRCQWCKGALLLSAVSLRSHLQSKHHRKRVPAHLQEDVEAQCCFAEDYESPESEGETHAERLERLRKEVQAAAEVPPAGIAKGGPHAKSRKSSKPGKRQRAEAKLQQAGGESGGLRRPQESKQRKPKAEKPAGAKGSSVGMNRAARRQLAQQKNPSLRTPKE